MVVYTKRAVKKFLHDHTVVVVVTAGLLLTLLLLIGFRILALVSIGDLSRINPLITSGQNKLAVKDGTSEIIKIPIDAAITNGSSNGNNTSGTKSSGGSSSGGSSTDGTVVASAGGSQTSGGGSTGGSSGGSSNGGGSSGSSGGSPAPATPTPTPSTPPPATPTPTPPAAIFSANLAPTMTFVASNKQNNFNGCRIDYVFTFTINVQNAPGQVTMQYQWPGSGSYGNQFNVNVVAGRTSVQVDTIKGYVIASNNSTQAVYAKLNSPNSVTKKYEFTHKC